MRQMMTELEIGQRRVDKNGDVRTVNSIGETHAWLVRESDGTGKTYTLAAAQKLHMAPPLVRSIRLTLAADTTETECGGCENLLGARSDFCSVFRRTIVSKPTTSDYPQRCVECIAAEVK